jgi:hypothetical protein
LIESESFIISRTHLNLSLIGQNQRCHPVNYQFSRSLIWREEVVRRAGAMSAWKERWRSLRGDRAGGRGGASKSAPEGALSALTRSPSALHFPNCRNARASNATST